MTLYRSAWFEILSQTETESILGLGGNEQLIQAQESGEMGTLWPLPSGHSLAD